MTAAVQAYTEYAVGTWGLNRIPKPLSADRDR
jgi:hypothetical protein